MTFHNKQYSQKITVLKAMRFLVILVSFILPLFSFGQREKPKNYSRFDERTFHFGFMLGVNRSDFTVFQIPEAYENYGLLSLTSKSTPGGQVGIVTTMKVGTPVVRLRFVPTISFQERVLNYSFINIKDSLGDPIGLEERIGSTNIDFPLMLQFRTLRHNNFAAYLLVGGQYSIDLQSQEKASQSLTDPFIKLKKKDFQPQVGAGVEFFMPYFKFGMEIKYSQSIKSNFIQDNTVPSNPIDRLYNNVLWLSFIFEG